MQSRSRRIAFLALLVSLGMILSYLESLLPVFYGVPGMKPGLCNILIVFLLYASGSGQALGVNLIRIFLTGLLFGNPYSIAYSLSGGIISLAVMTGLKKSGLFSVFGVSMAGGIAHNLGQIIIAVILIENYRIFLYFPVLTVSGCITGFFVGFLSSSVLIRLKPKGQMSSGHLTGTL